MEKFWRVYRWLKFGLGFLLVVGTIGLVYYTHTHGFRELVREKLLAAINDSIQGRLSVGRLNGSVWGSLTFVDVRLVHKENEILEIPELKVNFVVLPLIWGRLQVVSLAAAEPRLRLAEEADGTWNLVEALSPRDPLAESFSPVVSINSVAIRNADVDVNISEKSYRLAGLDVRGKAGIYPDRMSVDLQQISSQVVTKGQPEVRVKGALAYQDSSGRESLRFSDFAVESGGSALRINGTIDDLKTFETEAKLSIDKLAPVDVVGFVPQWPVKTVISGNVDLSGPLTALKGEFSLSVADGSMSGNFQTDLTRDSPAYQGMTKISRVNLAKLLERREVQGIASALVEVKGNGFALADIAGQGEAKVQSTSISTWNLGDVSLKAILSSGEAKVTGELKSELGRADWQGQIAFKEIPRYELNFSATDLEVQKFSTGQTIKGSLNLSGLVKGSGLTLAGMNTLAKIDVKPSKLGGVALEQGTLVAAIANQRIRVEQATLRAADANLAVKGDIGTDRKQQGRIEYQLRVKNLSPWLALMDRQGSGSADLTGEAKGSLEDLKSQGKLNLKQINFEGTAVQAGFIDYNLAYASSLPLPHGTLRISFSDVRNRYRLQSLEGAVKILAQMPPSFDLDLKARDAQGRTHTMAARLDYQPEHVVARVARLTLDLPDGAWRLSQPVTLEWRNPDFLVDRFVMRNNGRELFLNGRFSLAGSQALQLKVEKLPIEGLRAFFPEVPDVTGILSAEVQLGGSAAAPELAAAARLENSKIVGYSYGGLVASGSYRDQRVVLEATLRQDQLHELSATATLPMVLSWNTGWRAEVADNIDARIQSSGLDLAFFNALGGKAVQGIGGEVEVDLQVRGSLRQPVTQGLLRLRDGKLTATALNLQVSAIMVEGLVEPSGIRIGQLSARANKGELSGKGFIALEKFLPQGIDLSITAKQWPAINTQRYQIEASGAAKIDGTVAAPRITGKFEVPGGELRPDLSFLDRSNTPVNRDPTITVVSTKVIGSPAAKPENNGQADIEIWRNTVLDIQVRVPNNLWMRHRNGNAELSGNLRVTKVGGGPPLVSGFIETVRGWVAFQGRRFTLSRGRVEFHGSEKMTPFLDIVAEYRAGNYLVNAAVKGTAEKPTLTLSSNPALDQADILSVLLFNKPISSLDRSEQSSLQQNAASIASGFAAATIGQAVSESLGLQELGVDIGTVDFSGGQVRFGRYVGRDAYVTFSQEVSGKHGREVAVEYQITPEWRVSVSSSTTGADGADLIWQKRY